MIKQQIDDFFDAQEEHRSKDISYIHRHLIPDFASRKKIPIISSSKVIQTLLDKMMLGQTYRSLELVELAGVNFPVKQKLERDKRFVQVGRGLWSLR